jgi:hypothetical protein
MSVEPIHTQPRCVVCAEPLHPSALKCTKCDAFQDVRSCPSCGLPTARHAARCAYCNDYLDGRNCWLCGSSMPGKAVRCADCSTFQNWRRLIPTSQVTLALILSIISVISAIAPPVVRHYSNHSETYVRVLGPGKFKGDRPEEDLTIRVLVLNNGKRASFVKSASLTFDKTIHADDTELEVKNPDDALVAPEKSATLHFSVASVGRHGQKKKQDVLDEVLAGGEVTIKVTVEETDRNGKLFDAFPAHRIRADKIYNWMTDRVASD